METYKQVLTPEQKAKKAEYMKKYAAENANELAVYQKERGIKDKEKISERKKKYYQEHPEVRPMQSRAYYEANKEAIQLASKEYWEKNIEAIRARSSKYRKSPKGKLQSYKASAKVRGYDFSLSADDFMKFLLSNCHYCNKSEAMGLDRISSLVGYFSYNVVSCCKTCNFMKGTLEYQDFINQIKAINNHLLV